MEFVALGEYSVHNSVPAMYDEMAWVSLQTIIRKETLVEQITEGFNAWHNYRPSNRSLISTLLLKVTLLGCYISIQADE